MFDEVLRLRAQAQEVPVGEVQFRQRDRCMFTAVGGREPSAPAPVEGEGGAPVVVPVHQTDRRLFDRVLGKHEPPPLEAGDGGTLQVVPLGPCDHEFFQDVVRHDLGRRAARRGAWALAATAFQTVMIAILAFVTAQLAAYAAPEPFIEVAIVPTRQPRFAAPPPAAPAGVAGAVRRAGPAKPRPPGWKPPPPAALVQPRDVQPEMKATSADEPIEEIDYAYVGEGEGGVIGGIVGADVYEPEALAGGARGGGGGGGGIEEAPQYATAGFRRPTEARAGCVASSMRLPQELTGFVSGTITVKFGVGRDGGVGTIQIMGEPLDPRVVEAIRTAVRSCRWIPGADPRGQSVALWVILPIRFQSD